MPKWRAAAAASLVLGLLTLTVPAQAQYVAVADKAGDASRPGLDITRVAFANRDHAIVARFRFVHDARGTVIVAVRTRDHRLAQLVISQHRQLGHDRTFLIGHPPCPGLSSTWRRSAARLTLRLPARCVLVGDYGAIKAWALIEGLHSGADVDYAPQAPQGNIAFTPWIPRG
jgi:hypothetical protein